ncbi:SRPBCC family protein [Allosphingosinicella sp.]|uniref:SRPBCC family protein n=1 Tax=Allosphingosinicella sp. TaxID=2823234 RepID=UPI002FC1DC73
MTSRVMRGVNAALLLLAASPAAAQQIDVNLASETDGTRTLVHEITVPASLEEVWTALATVDGWRTWAVPLAREVPGSPDHFETGYDAGAEPGAASTIEQQWLERTKPYRVVFRTTRTPEGFPHADAYVRVTSSFLLTSVGAAATRVRLTGNGYPAGPAGDALIAFFREGNRVSLRQLHRRFAEGPIDWTASRSQTDEK